jgi:D-arabinose 1-dehydrogenase-like Zn-dependent alcohol dehydrogenase
VSGRKLSRASVLVGPRQMQIEEFAVPDELPAGSALLRVEGSGVCGSDVTQFTGKGAALGWCNYPLIPGHEPVGRIVKITEEAAQRWRLTEGDRIAAAATRRRRGTPGAAASPVSPYGSP